MTEEATVPAGEVETEVSAAQEVEEPEGETEALEPAEDGEDSQEEAPEEVEFDFGGNKLRIPKGSVPDELAEKIDAFAKGTWADYTKKSQTVAEQAKALEARQSVVEKIEGLQGKVLDTYSKGLQIRSEIEQLSTIDLNALWQSDPDQARRVSDAISQKRAAFADIVQEVNRQEQEITESRKAETARLLDEGKKTVLKRVPDFEKHLPEVIEYATKNFGISQKDAENWALNPVAAVTMHKAMMWDKMQAKTAKAVKPQPAQAVAVAPMKSSGKASAKLDLVKDADKMSPDEWLRQRNAQLKRA